MGDQIRFKALVASLRGTLERTIGQFIVDPAVQVGSIKLDAWNDATGLCVSGNMPPRASVGVPVTFALILYCSSRHTSIFWEAGGRIGDSLSVSISHLLCKPSHSILER